MGVPVRQTQPHGFVDGDADEGLAGEGEAWLRAYRDALIAQEKADAAQQRAGSSQRQKLLPLPGQ